jgi:5-methylcytosine-specific restriction endonuclease McrA
MVVVVNELNYISRKEQKCTVKGVKRRDNYKCQRCGCTDRSKLTIDHYYARCRFERIKEEEGFDYEVNSWFNLVTLCRDCNSKKGSKRIKELGWDIPRPEPPLFSIDINWNEILKED